MYRYKSFRRLSKTMRLLAALDGGLDGVDLEPVLLLDALAPPLFIARGLDACSIASACIEGAVAA
jgi:hypothetical protein